MGKRLSQIATRTGDDGTTGLGDGTRTGKESLRIAALGDYIGKPIALRVETLYTQEQYDIVLM